MNKKIQHYAGCLLLVGTLVCAEGCGNKWVLENPPTEIGDTVVETVTEAENTETIAEDVTETEVVEKEDDISRWSAEEYSAFFMGNGQSWNMPDINWRTTLKSHMKGGTGRKCRNGQRK